MWRCVCAFVDGVFCFSLCSRIAAQVNVCFVRVGASRVGPKAPDSPYLLKPCSSWGIQFRPSVCALVKGKIAMVSPLEVAIMTGKLKCGTVATSYPSLALLGVRCDVELQRLFLSLHCSL